MAVKQKSQKEVITHIYALDLKKIYQAYQSQEQTDAEKMTRRLAAEEGIFAGISSGGALHAALQLSKQVENAVIVSIVCDRGDRYLSTGVFPS